MRLLTPFAPRPAPPLGLSRPAVPQDSLPPRRICIPLVFPPEPPHSPLCSPSSGRSLVLWLPRLPVLLPSSLPFFLPLDVSGHPAVSGPNQWRLCLYESLMTAPSRRQKGRVLRAGQLLRDFPKDPGSCLSALPSSACGFVLKTARWLQSLHACVQVPSRKKRTSPMC